MMINGIPNRPLYFYQKDIIVIHNYRIPASEAFPRRGGRDLQRAAGTAATGAPALQRSAEPRVAGTERFYGLDGRFSPRKIEVLMGQSLINGRFRWNIPWKNGGL